MMTITYFVHGTTTDNEVEVSSGWNDVGLAERGIEQSEALPGQNPTEFAAVFCSDLSRAVDSTQISFGGKFPIVVDSRLRECNYGDFNGKLSEIVEPLQEQMVTTRFPNGESYEDVRERVELFLQDVKSMYEGKHIAIVAHKAPQLALEVIVNGKTWEQAFADDWRKTKSWQPGWKYFT